MNDFALIFDAFICTHLLQMCVAGIRESECYLIFLKAKKREKLILNERNVLTQVYHPFVV